jgi:hypothetical protein
MTMLSVEAKIRYDDHKRLGQMGEPGDGAEIHEVG